MNMVDLDALSAMAIAMDQSHIDFTGTSFMAMIAHLDEAGWQLTRKPDDPVITSVEIKDQKLTGATVKWPPPGIIHLFYIVNGQAKVILSGEELRYAIRSGHPLVSAINSTQAVEVYNDSQKILKTFRFDGLDIAYHDDPIPF